MSAPDLSTIEQACGRPLTGATLVNAKSLVDALAAADVLWQKHRLAHFLAQVLHESAALRYVREIWGPTPAQLRYEGRLDLGNIHPGDGKRYMGRGLIQCTGRANTCAFRDWSAEQGLSPPDFEAQPEMMETSPWSALTAVWYWTARGLNELCDGPESKMDRVERITRKVNGGINGLADRQRYYTRSALVLLGRAPDDVRGFQAASGLAADGIPGPLTRKALHAALRALRAAGAAEDRLEALEARLAALEAWRASLGAGA